MPDGYKISDPVSICPAAPGWRAAYRSADTPPMWIVDDVIMWAVFIETDTVTGTGERKIHGVVMAEAGPESAEGAPGFVAYLGPDDPDPEGEVTGPLPPRETAHWS